MMRSHCCDKSDVKKGVWTPEEDAKMLAYVSRHGTGNWTSVPKKAGLKRCGKSCRLRWSNYLRPDLKHGSFTPQEEELIIKLHATIGSRWSIIAQQLPGRTDNDVKNHWNTKLKKKLSERGIDPVTHKPFSQILADYGSIGGLPRVSNTRIGSLNKDLKNAFTLKAADDSHLQDEIAVTSNNSIAPESSISQFEYLNGNKSINNQYRTYSTDLLSQLQAIKMFTEVSNCSSDSAKLSSSLCCESPILLSPSSSSSSTCSAVKSPAANLNWQDYLLEDAFLPAAYSKDHDDKSELLMTSNGFLAGDDVQRGFNGTEEEVIMQQQHSNALNSNCFRASASSSNHSFVDDMLARDNEMMLSEFSDLLEEPFY